jgi:bifunctional DNase/RNase
VGVSEEIVQYTAFSPMDVTGIHFDLPDPSPVVYLTETDAPYRPLALHLALPDATSIAYAWRKVDAPRPNGHDVTTSLLQNLRADVICVRIFDYAAGVYYAELDVMASTGRFTVTCRPSDGIALALRQSVPAPILVAKDLLEPLD